MKQQNYSIITPYLEFNYEYWTILHNSIPVKLLTNKELIKVKKISDEISVDEVNKIYLPISRLLDFYINLSLYKQTILEQFLTKNTPKIPYIIGITGSVAVGKSTTARLLQILLNKWSKHRKIDLITTDGFLYSNKFLNKCGLMKKKGFPQSYDMHRLIKFISDIKSGVKQVTSPVYSHLTYDIIPDKKQVIKQPDILILEGLNILQKNTNCKHDYRQILISDFIDFSIYIDASENLLKNWYINRFIKFCQMAFYDPHTYFYNFSRLKQEEINKTAELIWEEINKINLKENIIPTKEKANLIMTKGHNHSIINIKLRKSS